MKRKNRYRVKNMSWWSLEDFEAIYIYILNLRSKSCLCWGSLEQTVHLEGHCVISPYLSSLFCILATHLTEFQVIKLPSSVWSQGLCTCCFLYLNTVYYTSPLKPSSHAYFLLFIVLNLLNYFGVLGG